MLRARREPAFGSRARLVGLMLLGFGTTACATRAEPWATERGALSPYTDALVWSRKPPGLEPVDVPQFVAVTFDDNFVSGLGDVSGGMTWATSFLKPLQNQPGSGYAPTFDGAPVRTKYALSKPVVRMRPVANILEWMRHPEPLNGVVTYVPPAGGAGAGGLAGSTSGAGGSAGAGGSSGASAGAAITASVAGAGGSSTPAAAAMAQGSSPACTCGVPGPSAPASRWLTLAFAFVLAALARRRKMPILGPSCAS